MPAAADPVEPKHGFDDSRRLPGPNRWFAGSAVQLTPLGAFARDGGAHAAWAQRVRHTAARLGWPAPQPLVHMAAGEVTLAFTAPPGLLFTATELNEWAWERCAAERGERGVDIAQDWGDNPLPALRARAGAEWKPALAALREAAASHGVALLEDDDAVTLGSGDGGSAAWPLTGLPAADTVDWPSLRDVPRALVTGSNGKTTTVRLLAAMLQAAGRTAGYCCTEGVFVGGVQQAGGDYSGPAGARTVLRHPRVQAAVLETARGGILRRGLAVHAADVALVTNISPDHLGEYGVENANDLAEVKLVVARAVRNSGTLVLNGGDTTLLAAARHLDWTAAIAAAGRLALFAHDHDAPALQALRLAGGSTCGVDAAAGGRLLLWQGPAQRGSPEILQADLHACAQAPPPAGVCHDLGATSAMPLTLDGTARHNVENSAAAALAAAALGLAPAVIASTLASFGANPLDNAGRLERWRHHGATVLIDYAHNPDGLAQLLAVARALQSRRLGLLLGQAGNRGDAAIADLARAAAAARPDRVVVKELPLMLRGRAPATVPALLTHTLLAAGVAPSAIAQQPDEMAAALQLLDWAGPGDVVVLPVHTDAVRALLRARLQEAPPAAANPAPEEAAKNRP